MDTPRRDHVPRTEIPARAIVAWGAAAGDGLVIDTGGLRRAIWLKIQPVSWGCLVSGGAAAHVVGVDGGRVTCHCPDAERMGDGCKHSLALRLRAGDGEVIDALRLLIPNPSRVR